MHETHTTPARSRARRRVAATVAVATGTLAVAGALSTSPAEAALPTNMTAVLPITVDANDQPTLGAGMIVVSPNPNTLAEVKRVGTGQYRITITGVRAKRAAVDITTLHSPNDPGNDPLCSVKSYTTTSKATKITINCFDPVTGKRAPGRRFDVVATDGTVPPQLSAIAEVGNEKMTVGYLRTNSPSNAKQEGITDPKRPRVKSLGKGKYTVTFRNAKWVAGDGVVTTTAISSAPRWCNPMSWGPGGDGGVDLVVEVQCYKPGGVGANSKFSIIATRKNQFGLTPLAGAAAAADLGPDNGPMSLQAYTYNSEGGGNGAFFNATHTATVVTFGNLNVGYPISSDMVGAIKGSHRCALSTAPILVLGNRIAVRCHDAAGVAIKAPVTAMTGALVE